MPYVFSTLSSPVAYTLYNESERGAHTVKSKIIIKGGAGVANKNLITPLGVATEVTEEELEVLKTHPVFKLHLENGYVKIKEKQADAEVVAADMNSRDESAPLTPNDFKDEDQAKPVEKEKKNKNKK